MLTLNECLTVTLLWLESSKLKLNVDKTDIIIIGTKQQRNKVVDYFTIKLLDNQSYITMGDRSEFTCCCLWQWYLLTPEHFTSMQIIFDTKTKLNIGNRVFSGINYLLQINLHKLYSAFTTNKYICVKLLNFSAVPC